MKKKDAYKSFLKSKAVTTAPSGFDISQGAISEQGFPFQRDVVRWELRKGKSAMFEDCGLGKTWQSLEWSRHVFENTNVPILNVAPLSVSKQTQREGEKFSIPVNIAREQSEVKRGVNITNYEMLPHFDPREFAGIYIDESSILKGDGPLRKRITEFAAHIPYRLAGTATPAPNDYMELGNHAEFLGIMSKSEMLSTFFVHDGGDTSKWRLKGHAEKAFWQWVASWAVMLRKPSDLGYDDAGFTLPALHYHQHTVPAEWSADYLFPVEAKDLRERQQARRDSLDARVRLAADLVNASTEQWLCWCNLNAESEALARLIPTAVEVTGSDTTDHKENAPMQFISGEIKDLVSKPEIFGWGMNFQHCNHALACGLSDSWEKFHQIVRRMWRFGQTRECHMHVITGELEGGVVRNIERKEKQAIEMASQMVGYMREINTAEIHGTIRETETYTAKKRIHKPEWLLA